MNEKIDISPADIRHKEFSTSVLGYSRTEIRDYLDMLADHFEDLYTQRVMNHTESAQVQVFDDKSQTQLAIEQIKKREELIAKTLIQAENSRNEIIRVAKAEAENIIKQATISAQKAIDETNHYINQLKHEFITLKEHRRQFVSNAHAQLKIAIERLEQDPMFMRDKESDIDMKFEDARRIKLHVKDPNETV